MNADCISPDETPSHIENLHYLDLDLHVLMDKTVSLTLKWTTLNNSIDPITHCNIYASNLLGTKGCPSWNGDHIYLGMAHANCFRVCCLHILSNNLKEQPFGFEFKVQPVTSSRRKPSIDNSNSLTVWLCT